MSYVDEKYQEHLDSQSGSERLQRTCSLFEETVAMLKHQILTELPDLEEHELRLRVAEILYQSDNGAQRLIGIARSLACS